MAQVDWILRTILDEELEARTLFRLADVMGAPVKALYRRAQTHLQYVDRCERTLATIPLDDDE